MSIKDIGSNIRRQMKIKGFTIPELAEKTAMGTATISNILNGKSEPKSSTLLKIAEALNSKLTELLADTPKLTSLRFRTLKKLSGREKAERDQIIQNTAIWLDNFNYLEQELKQKSEFTLESLKFNSPIEAAKEVRKKLKIKENHPVYDISNLIESAGIKLFIQNFGFKQTFGMSVGPKDGGPAIIINSDPSISIERQIFTIAHELGHLLLHKESYDLQEEDENNNQEAEANSFAGAFLLPDAGLKEEWDDAKGLHWVDAVLRIKKIFKVSYKTVLVRLCEMKPELNKANVFKNFAIYYKKKYNHDLKNHYEPHALEDPVASQDPDALSKNDLVEDRFANLVRRAYQKGIISISRAAEMLHKSMEDMRELVSSWQDSIDKEL